MKVAKNMESIFVTVAFVAVSVVWFAPASEYTEIQVNANVSAPVSTTATTSAKA
jgi:hypothetical protein